MLSVVEDALCMIIVEVVMGVTNTRSLEVTPVAEQVVIELELAVVEGTSTTQVPKSNLTNGEPSPIETAVLDALNRGVIAFACGIIIDVVEAREFVVSTSKIGVLEELVTDKAWVPFIAIVVVASVVVPAVVILLPIVAAANTTPAIAKVVISVAIATCDIDRELIIFFINSK